MSDHRPQEACEPPPRFVFGWVAGLIELAYGYWTKRGRFPTFVLMLRPVHALQVSSGPNLLRPLLHPKLRDLHLQFLDPVITPVIRHERLTFAELRETMTADTDAPHAEIDEQLLWRWLMSAVRRRLVVAPPGVEFNQCTWDLTNVGMRTSGPGAALGPIARLLGVGSVLAVLAEFTKIAPLSEILHVDSGIALGIIGVVPALLSGAVMVFLAARRRMPILIRQVSQREREVRALLERSNVVPWWPGAATSLTPHNAHDDARGT